MLYKSRQYNTGVQGPLLNTSLENDYFAQPSGLAVWRMPQWLVVQSLCDSPVLSASHALRSSTTKLMHFHFIDGWEWDSINFGAWKDCVLGFWDINTKLKASYEELVWTQWQMGGSCLEFFVSFTLNYSYRALYRVLNNAVIFLF